MTERKFPSIESGDRPRTTTPAHRDGLRRHDDGRLLLTDYADAKLRVYAQAAATDEFMVLLLGRKGEDNLVRDVYLLKDQKISSASVEVSGHAINLSMWDLEDRYGDRLAILSWGHGHGRSAVFHSAIDDDNSESVFLDQLAPLRMIENQAAVRLPVDPNNPRTFSLGPYGAIRISADGLSDEMLKNLTVEKIHPVYQGFIYSLVTNVEHEYYAERFTKTFCHHCDHIAVVHQKIEVAVVKTKKQIQIDEDALRAEFKEKTAPLWGTFLSRRDDHPYSEWSDYYQDWKNPDGSGSPGVIIHQKWYDDDKYKE